MNPSVLLLIAPEIFVTIMASLVLLASVYTKGNKKTLSYALSIITLLAVTIITWRILPAVTQNIFDGGYIVDRFACLLKIVLYVLLAAIFIYSKMYMQERDFFNGEFFSLSLFSMLGMMIVISSSSFLTLYLGLELLVLPLYAMIVLVKNQVKYAEAAMKYFVIGSLGAGILLFGISLIYGATGSFAFNSISSDATVTPLLQTGMLFVVVGVALEFGAVPFHMWLPDVYEGSHTTVTMLIGTIPKIAVFAMAYRLLTLAFPALTPDWQQLFMIMAVISIMLGNILAIAQVNIKRMLAYSTISHIGFILLGLFAAPQQGYVAPIFYTIIYAFMVLAAFAIIIRLSAKGFEADFITDFRGLNKRDPWLAFLMLLTMFALAGVPPLVGFYAKFMILQNVVNAGFPWLAILALIFTVIGAFYYLRVVKVMYFEEPDLLPGDTCNMTTVAKILVSGHGLLLLLLGMFPAAIISFCIAMLK